MLFTERRVDGMLKLVGDGLVLEFRVTESVTTMGAGYASDESASEVSELAVPLDRVVALHLKTRWWGPRLTIVTDSLRFFESVPGSKQGRLDLRIARRDLPMAELLEAEVRVRLADLSLKRVEEDALADELRRLDPGSDAG